MFTLVVCATGQAWAAAYETTGYEAFGSTDGVVLWRAKSTEGNFHASTVINVAEDGTKGTEYQMKVYNANPTGDQTADKTIAWQRFASNQDSVYAAPGKVLVYDETGYRESSNAQFAPLSFGGLYVKALAAEGTPYTIIDDKSDTSDRKVELGASDYSTVFKFEKSFTFDRNSATEVKGTATVDIDSGATFTINARANKGAKVDSGNTLILKGSGTLAVTGGLSVGGTLDISNSPATIDGDVILLSGSTLVLPAGTAKDKTISIPVCSGTLTVVGTVNAKIGADDAVSADIAVSGGTITSVITDTNLTRTYTTTVNGDANFSTLSWEKGGVTCDWGSGDSVSATISVSAASIITIDKAVTLNALTINNTSGGAVTLRIAGSSTLTAASISIPANVTLEVANTTAITASSANISGAGNIAFASGTFTLNGNNSSLTGNIIVKNGAKIVAGSTNAFGRTGDSSATRRVIAESGGTIDINGKAMGLIYRIAGDGEGEGALINKVAGVLGSSIAQMCGLELTGSASVNSTGYFGVIASKYNTGILDIPDGCTLTKYGSNDFYLCNINGGGKGKIVVSAGMLFFKQNAVSIPNVTIEVSGSSSYIGGNANLTAKKVKFMSGGMLHSSWTGFNITVDELEVASGSTYSYPGDNNRLSTGTLVIGGTVNWNGYALTSTAPTSIQMDGGTFNVFQANGNTKTLSSEITGAGSIVVWSNYAADRDQTFIDFTGDTTGFTGTTTVKNGTLIVSTGGEGSAVTLSSENDKYGKLKFKATERHYNLGYKPNITRSSEDYNTVSYTYGDSAIAAEYIDGVNLLPQGPTIECVASSTVDFGTVDSWTNYSGESAPSSGCIVIQAATSATLNIDENATFDAILVRGSGSVTIAGSGSLTTSELIIDDAVTLNVNSTGIVLSTGGTISGTGTLNVSSGITYELNGVTCSVHVTCAGKLITQGTTVLSNSTSTYSGEVVVESGTTDFNSAQQGVTGKITIDSGATLRTDFDQWDHLNYEGTCEVHVYGTLNFQNVWSVGSNNAFYFYNGCTISGQGNTHVASIDWIGAKVYVKADRNGGKGTVTLPVTSRLRANTTIEVDEGMTFTMNGPLNSSGGTGFGFTKQGGGVFNFTPSSTDSFTGTTTVAAGQMIMTSNPTFGTIQIDESAVFTLRSDLNGSTTYTGTGTLELENLSGEKWYLQNTAFAGKIKTKNSGSNYWIGGANANGGQAPLFSGYPELIAESGQQLLNRNFNGNTLPVRDLSGNATFYVGNANSDADRATRTVSTKQTKNTTFGGLFKSYNDCTTSLSVYGEDSANVYALTLTGASTSAGGLTVSTYAKVVFSGAGSWHNGLVTVGANGYLESTNAAAVTKLTLQDGANIVFPASSSKLSSISAMTFASGTTKIHFGSGVTPTAGTLINWSAANLEAAPAGEFAFADSTLAGEWILTKSADGLFIAAAAAKVTPTTGNPVPYASVELALNDYAMLLNTDEGATMTILNGTTLTELEVIQLAAANIYYDRTSGVLTKAVAKVGQTCYPSLSAAISDGAVVTLLRDSSEAITLNGESIEFSEGSSTFSGSFTGNGTLIMTALPNSLATTLWSEGWTGTLWLKNISFPTIASGDDAGKPIVNPVVFGNANSTLRLTSCRGGFDDNFRYDATKHKFPGTLDLVDENDAPAFSVTSGWPNFGKTVFAKLTGTGTLTSGDPSKAHYYQFLDASEFRGTITIPSNGKFRVGIGSVDANSGNGDSIADRTLTIQTGASATIASGKTWSAPGGIEVNGTLNCNGGKIYGTGASGTLTLGGSGLIVNTFEGGDAQCFNAGAITVSGSLQVKMVGGWSNFGTWTLTDTASLGFDPGTDDEIYLNSTIAAAPKETTIHIYGDGTKPVVDNDQDGTKDAVIHVHNGGTFQVSANAADNDRLKWDSRNDVGGITVDAGGKIVFKSRETYTRNTTLAGGTFRLDGIQSERSIDIYDNIDVNVTENSIIEATGDSHWIYLRSGTPTFTVDANKTLTVNAGFTYSFANNMTKAGAGTMVVNGYVDGSGNHESFSQPKGVTINAGTYELNAVQTSNNQTGADANFYTVAAGAKLKIGATGQANMTTLNLFDGSLLEFGASNATLINANTVTFTSGAVAVSLSDGVTPTNGTKLIGWTTAPAGGTFTLEGCPQYHVVAGSDGLYLMKKSGTIFSVW